MLALAAAVVVVLGLPLFSRTLLLYSHDINYFYAHEVVVRHSFAQGDFPFWNPYFGGGAPGLSKIQIGLFYPPLALLRMVLPPVIMFNVGVALHLTIAALGVYWLLRDYGVRLPAATFGGLIFALSAAFIPRILAGHASVIHSIAWTGWLLFAYRRLLHAPSWHHLLLTTGFVTLTLLGGHPQMSAIVLLAPATYLLAFLVGQASERAWRTIPIALLASASVPLLAFGLAAAQLVPFIDWIGYTSRGTGQAHVISRMTDHSFFAYDLVRLLLPHVFTDVRGQAIIGATGSGNFWEKSAFVGIVPLAVIGFAIWTRALRMNRRIVYFAALALLGLTASMGTINPLYLLLARYAPYIRAPGRFLVLWVFAVAVLAAFALDKLVDGLGNHPQFRGQMLAFAKRVLGAAALAATLALVWTLFWDRFLFGPTASSARESYGHVAATVTQAFFPFLVTLVLITALFAIAAQVNVTPQRWALLALLTLFVELFLYSRFSITGHPLDNLYDPEHPLARLAPPASEARLDGARVPPLYLVPTLHHVYNGEEHIALDALLALPEKRGVSLLAAGYEVSAKPLHELDLKLVDAAENAFLYRRNGTLPRLYAAPAVQIVSSDQEALELISAPSFRPREKSVVTAPNENNRLRGALKEEAEGDFHFRGEITHYENNYLRTQIAVNQPALVTLADLYHPGWSARVDGVSVPVLKANYAFRGVMVAAGEHTIEMNFIPADFRLGLAISVVTALVLAAVTLLRGLLPAKH
jgi:hypothetical protein